MASTIRRDLKSEVQRYENLNTPVLEYQFSRRNFVRPVNSTTGIYGNHGPNDYGFDGGGDYFFEDKTDFFFN
jgi:hypothetical protein